MRGICKECPDVATKLINGLIEELSVSVKSSWLTEWLDRPQTDQNGWEANKNFIVFFLKMLNFSRIRKLTV